MPSRFLPKLNFVFSSVLRRELSGRASAIVATRPNYQVVEGWNLSFSETILPARAIHSGNPFLRKSMAASGSKDVCGHLYVENSITSNGNVSCLVKPATVFFTDRSLRRCQKASMSLEKRKPPNNYSIYGYFMIDLTWRICNSNPLTGPLLKNFCSSSSACYSATAPNMSFNGSSCDEQLANSAVPSDQYDFPLGYFCVGSDFSIHFGYGIFLALVGVVFCLYSCILGLISYRNFMSSFNVGC